MNMKYHFTAEFKAKLVQPILRGEQTINQLAAEYSLHPHQLYRWREITLACRVCFLVKLPRAKRPCKLPMSNRSMICMGKLAN